MSLLTYNDGALLPNAHLTALDDTDTVIDLSSGYTFAATLYDPSGSSAHTQSSGITGAATAPNITIAWTSGFASLAANRYTLRVVATLTSGSKPRIFETELVIK